MKDFVQVKFREFQMAPKSYEFSKFFFVIIFKIFHFGPQIFHNFQFDRNKFIKNCKLIPQIFQKL